MRPAKTTRPLVRRAVVRDRLIRRLDAAKRAPATWVSAPPGAGKTTLVASYLEAKRTPTIWYQIDEGDADLATFFHYLGDAAPRRRRPLPHFTPEYRDALPAFTRMFFRELYARLKGRFVLVFDNYQDVPARARFHEVIRRALEELPTRGRAIVISRAGPPPAFSRLRAGRAIALVDPAELRFTAGESRRMIRALAPGRWPRKTLQAISKLSDGWAAGLVLLLEQLRTEGKTSAAPPRHTADVIFEYFADEIFARLPANNREVLLQTALLPSVTPAIAEQLTGHPTAGEILKRLHRHQYFTNRQGGTEPTYQYHPLFRAFLVAHAATVYPAARLAAIRANAAALVEAAGQVEIAAGLLRDGGAHANLAGLICRHAPMLLAHGRVEPLTEWLASLPDASFSAIPWLFFWRGMCRFTGQDPRSPEDFRLAFAAFRRLNDHSGMFSAWAAVIMSHVAESNTLPIDDWIAQLDILREEAPAFPSDEIEMRVAASMLAAIYLRQPNRRDGAEWAERALRLVRAHPDLVFRSITMLSWYLYHYELGDLAKAAIVVDEMRALMEARDQSPVVYINASTVVAVHECAFALPSYRRTVSVALDRAHASGLPQVTRQGLLFAGIQSALSDGDVATTRRWLAEMQTDLDRVGPGYRGWYHMTIVRLALLEGDLEKAAAHQPEMLRLTLAAGWTLNNATAYLISAEVLQQRGRQAEARKHVAQAVEIGEAIPSPYVEFMARLTMSNLCFLGGDTDGGLEALRAGMAAGRAGGYLNSWVWHPLVMARLCARALDAGIEVEYVRGLIKRRGLVLDQPPVDSDRWPWPIKVYSLGRFEVLKDDQPLRFASKVQRKPLELLKTLVSFGGRGVRERLVSDVLWPDRDGDAVRFALTTSIHRLRRLLGREDVLIRKGGLLSLDPGTCWIDVWALERLLDRADSLVASAAENGAFAERMQCVQRAAALHGGAEPPADDVPSFAAGQLRRRLTTHLAALASQCAAAGQLQEAAMLYERGISVDPCAEDCCRGLMQTYGTMGRRTEVVSVYQACQAALSDRLGIAPAPQTHALFSRLR